MTEHENPDPQADDDAVEVREDPDRHRFDILVGGRQAGFSLYTSVSEDDADQRIFYHTVIDDDFGGRGLAGVLTRTSHAGCAAMTTSRAPWTGCGPSTSRRSVGRTRRPTGRPREVRCRLHKGASGSTARS